MEKVEQLENDMLINKIPAELREIMQLGAASSVSSFTLYFQIFFNKHLSILREPFYSKK